MKGSVRIRLARFGRKHAPVYNIVVAKAKSGRDKLPVEVIGTYNPIATPLTPEQKERGEKPVKDIKIDFHRSKYWIGVGAQPTEVVARLFRKAGVLPPQWPGPNSGPVVPKKNEIQGVKAITEPLPEPPVR
ncbi:mitochondrial 37S ribosomal protein MRPS16 [Sugiyamaella lignohabitans]|uniref:Mitochondrial 37S ribosomal protein MRPS16 n=1 Tax=Sugiyamaella lignohabitans TaxID=796027 RepID=A0A167EUA2_9ASCO|nr:mitochondrial 37S ribosomal protein MRPS16 [Sugiyamaella lignohabitans]ANB14463.1 mitochondrial 37S ribosomal protein MRPS16 [Sugiyamaella lignohabitans]